MSQFDVFDIFGPFNRSASLNPTPPPPPPPPDRIPDHESEADPIAPGGLADYWIPDDVELSHDPHAACCLCRRCHGDLGQTEGCGCSGCTHGRKVARRRRRAA